MILAFTKVCLPLLDYPDSEAVQIFTGVLWDSVECCSAVRLFHAAVLKQACIIGTYTVCELTTWFSPVAHYASISYVSAVLWIDRFVL